MPKVKKQKKLKSASKLKKEAWDAFSKWIRLRDALLTTGSKDHAKCTTCGNVYPVKEMDAGHFKHNAYDFDERNVHAQCVRCNKFLHGNGAVYTLFMIDRYGRKVVDFLTNVRDTKIYTRDEYEELRDYYKEEFKECYKNN